LIIISEAAATPPRLQYLNDQRGCALGMVLETDFNIGSPNSRAETPIYLSCVAEEVRQDSHMVSSIQWTISMILRGTRMAESKFNWALGPSLSATKVSIPTNPDNQSAKV
jgi:hypothetical protein